VRLSESLFYEFRNYINKEQLEPKVKLMLRNNYVTITDLITFNISEDFILYEKIIRK